MLSAVKEIVISSPKLNKSVLRKTLAGIEPSIKIKVITKTENNNIANEVLYANENSNCEFIMNENVFQSFAVIDRRIVWYGSINFLSYNYSEESAMRFLNESIAGRLADTANYREKLFDY